MVLGVVTFRSPEIFFRTTVKKQNSGGKKRRIRTK